MRRDRLRCRTLFPLLVLATAVTCTTTGAIAAPPSRVLLDTFQVGGPDGWDYATLDDTTHTLYVAHGSAIAAVNLVTKTTNRHLADARGAHVAVPFANGSKLMITHGTAGQVTLNDAKTGAVDATIATDTKPDAALIEPVTGRGFVMANGGGMVDVIDLQSKMVIARIAVNGAPEAATTDGHGLVFTHLEDRNAMVVIDAKAMTVKATYALSGCDKPSGIAAIPKRGLVLSACANQLARITNAMDGERVASLAVGNHPDAAFWDEKHDVGYVPCGDGTLTVINFENGAAHVSEVVRTQAGARTGAVDPLSGYVYLPTSELGPPANPGGRPSIVPDTFKILVVGLAAR